MLCRQHRHQAVACKGDLLELGLVGARVADKRKVDVLAQEHLLEPIALALDKLYLIAGACLLKINHGIGDAVGCHDGDRAHGDVLGGRGLIAAERGEVAMLQRGDLLCIDEERLALRRERHMALRAVDKFATELALHAHDVLGERRLRHKEQVGGIEEGA